MFELHTLLMWNTLPADRIDFSSFAAFKWTVQQIELSTFFTILLGLRYYQCRLWPCNPVHTCFMSTFYVYVFMCENKDDDKLLCDSLAQHKFWIYTRC